MTENRVRFAVWISLLAAMSLASAAFITSLLDETVAYAQSQPAQEKPAKAKPAKAAKEKPAAAAPAPAAEKPNYEAILNNLKFREIGPAIMGGRIDDFAVVESNPGIVFVGTASGGVLKSVNGGTTWEPVFDNEAVSTIGDVTIAPSDPSIVWVGTGEPNNRQSSSWGNGVYKSTDGGKTWMHMGLKETHHIGRIVIHPSDPNVVYVASPGRLWGPSRERGVFKTTDGGKTWTNVLFINEDTGVIDIALDHRSPGTLYAAAYQRRRTAFGFNGSGPHGGLYKTTDGGAAWKKLEKGLPWDPSPRPVASAAGGPGFGGGFPQAAPPPPPPAPAPTGPQEIGRIGVTLYRSRPDIVYTIIEHKNGGVFRSEDKGETWTRMSNTNPRPMYYSQIIVDPNNDQRIWVMGAPMYFSEDGGRTFRTNLVTRIHGDYHAMWINPADSDHMLVGSDGGIHWTHDRGRTWDFVNTLPLGQFYEIGVDMSKPYNVCGGLQDNGSWCAPSATLYARGISNDEWFNVAGGDGYYVQIDPTDPNILYAESQDGNVLRRDLRTRESKSIRPQPAEGEPRYRFQWNSPIVISAHDPKTIYYGGNFLFKSADRGDNWTKLGGDLTTGAERDKLPIMGEVPDKDTLSRHDGVQQWPCITAVSESPLSPSVLWVGTDDGNLHLTRDAGRTWKNVAEKVPGVPKGTYVSRVSASRHAEGTAYVTFDGHRNNDFNIYVFTTTDYGETWKAISNGLPANNGVVNVVREHRRNPDLLFAGTEYGAFVSFDRGANWSKIKMNLPTVPVDDIAIHPRENDLVFGTHGRSIWILDDITSLEQMNDRVAASEFHLFDVRPATAWRLHNHKASTGHKIFLGPNPPNGAIIQYYLKRKVEEDQPPAQSATPGATAPQAGAEQPRRSKVKVTFLDSEGNTVRELDGTGEAGINRVVWDLRYRSPIPPGPPVAGPGFGLGFAAQQAGSRVDPGQFTVKVSVEGKEASKTIVVEDDPRITISAADRAARRQAINQLAPLMGQVVMAQRGITGLGTSLSNETEAWKRPGAARIPENVKTAAEELAKKVQEVCKKFATPTQCGAQPTEGLGSAGPPLVDLGPTLPQRVGQVLLQLEGYTAAPTAWQLDQVRILSSLVPEAAGVVRKLVQEDLAALNKLMNEAGVPHISIPTPGRPGGPGMDDADDGIESGR